MCRRPAFSYFWSTLYLALFLAVFFLEVFLTGFFVALVAVFLTVFFAVFLEALFLLALASASSGISLLAIGDPSPLQASHPGPAENAPLLP